MRRQSAVLWAGALAVALSCRAEREKPATTDQPPAQEPSQRSGPRMVPPPPARTVDSIRRRGVDSVKVGDTLRLRAWTSDSILAVKTRIDSSWVIVTPTPLPFASGIPYGTMNLPPDLLCQQGTLGHSLTTFPAIRSDLLSKLSKAKTCKGNVILQLPRRIMVRGQLKGPATTVSYMRDSLPDFCPYVRDSTILVWWIGDDVNSTEYGTAPMSVKMARWDSMGRAVKLKCAETATWMRALPEQLIARPLEGRPDTLRWRWIDAAGAQYTGPRRHGNPATYFATQIAASKAMGLRMITGLNVLNGGCGPPTTGDCLLGVPGISFAGTRSGLYQMSAPELAFYIAAGLKDPAVCAFEMWGWSGYWGTTFHDRADNKAAILTGAGKAAIHQRSSCRRGLTL